MRRSVYCYSSPDARIADLGDKLNKKTINILTFLDNLRTIEQKHLKTEANKAMQGGARKREEEVQQAKKTGGAGVELVKKKQIVEKLRSQFIYHKFGALQETFTYSNDSKAGATRCTACGKAQGFDKYHAANACKSGKAEDDDENKVSEDVLNCPERMAALGPGPFHKGPTKEEAPAPQQGFFSKATRDKEAAAKDSAYEEAYKEGRIKGHQDMQLEEQQANFASHDYRYDDDNSSAGPWNSNAVQFVGFHNTPR